MQRGKQDTVNSRKIPRNSRERCEKLRDRAAVAHQNIEMNQFPLRKAPDIRIIIYYAIEPNDAAFCYPDRCILIDSLASIAQ